MERREENEWPKGHFIYPSSACFLLRQKRGWFSFAFPPLQALHFLDLKTQLLFSFFSYLKRIMQSAKILHSWFCFEGKESHASSSYEGPQGMQTWVRRLHLQILRESILRKWCCGVFQTLQYFIHLSKSLVEENKWKKRKKARFGELRKEQVGDKHLMLFH